jgi:FKBP-type peptidyl-prolyl cis-trans isomerase
MVKSRIAIRLFLLPFVFGLVASCASERPQITPSGLAFNVVAKGLGPQAVSGQYVKIHETTKLADGTVIFTTRKNGKPILFLLGGNQVITGVDEGVQGMQVGERRKLIVPPSLSKRAVYPTNTPPDATLYYDIQLVEIVNMESKGDLKK